MLNQIVWNITPLMCCIQHTLISPENWWFPYWSAPSCCYVCGGHSQLSPSKAKILAYLDARRVTAYLSYLGRNNSLTLKQLSRKRVMLFALTCPEISSFLTRFDLLYCSSVCSASTTASACGNVFSGGDCENGGLVSCFYLPEILL